MPLVVFALSSFFRTSVGKLLIAMLVFGGIVGTYAIARARDASRSARLVLPDSSPRHGACTLWFVGSSTIFRWTTLARDMAPWDAHDRGVNGAMIPEIVGWFGNEPAGPPPAAIVWYGGENDIAAGASGMKAFALFQQFMAAKTRRLGAVPVIALSLKSSPARWAQRPQHTIFNDALRRYAATRPDLSFVDIRPLMVREGRPAPYYVDDGIHMSAAGYARWTGVVRPALSRILPAPLVRRCAMQRRAER